VLSVLRSHAADIPGHLGQRAQYRRWPSPTRGCSPTAYLTHLREDC